MQSQSVHKILKLLEEGKISAEDAQDLLEAIGQKPQAPNAEDSPGASATFTDMPEGETEAASDPASEIPPPPPPPRDSQSAPYAGVVEAIEKIGRDISQNVNWTEIGEQIKTGAQRGAEFLKKTADQIKDGNFGIFIGDVEKREVSYPLNLQDGQSLRIENHCGGVSIKGGSTENKVISKAVFRGADAERLKQEAESYTLFIEENPHQITIRQADTSLLSVEIEVHTVGHVAVHVETSHGDIQLENCDGSSRAMSNSGDVNAKHISGSLTAETRSGDIMLSDSKLNLLNLECTNGDVELNRVEANTTLRGTTGDIRLNEMSGRTLSVESTTGDIHLDLVSPVEGNIDIRTVSGDVLVSIPDGGNCRVSLSTLRGETLATVDLADVNRSPGKITGVLGVGEGSINLSAVSGDVVLRMRDHAR